MYRLSRFIISEKQIQTSDSVIIQEEKQEGDYDES